VVLLEGDVIRDVILLALLFMAPLLIGSCAIVLFYLTVRWVWRYFNGVD